VLKDVLIVNDAEDPEAGFGLTLAVAPLGNPVTGGDGNVTAPAPFARVMDTVEPADAPWTTVCADGLTDRPKFAAF
jgi:hypothetical protein